MGLRDVEQLYLVKQVIHLIIGACILVWVAKKERKTRYHQLLIYLAVVSSVLCIVRPIDQIGCAEISLKGGFILLIATQVGYCVLTQDHPQSDDTAGLHGCRARTVHGVAVYQPELPPGPPTPACEQDRRCFCSM